MELARRARRRRPRRHGDRGPARVEGRPRRVWREGRAPGRRRCAPRAPPRPSRPRRPRRVPGGSTSAARRLPASRKPRRHHSAGGPSAPRGVALADLEDGDVGAAVPLVEGEHVEEARDQARAQDRVALRERVAHADRVAGDGVAPGTPSAAVDRPAQAAGVRLRHQRRRHDLGEAGADERAAHRVAALERVGPVVRHRRVRRLGRHRVVAADAGDLLGDVGLDERGPGATSGRSPRARPRRRARRAASRPRPRRWARPVGRAPRRCRPAPAGPPARPSSKDVPSSRLMRAGRKATRASTGLDRGRVDAPGGRSRRRPRRRSARRRGRRRSGRAGPPGPSRSAGSPPSGGRSGRRCGGCSRDRRRPTR